MSMMRDFRVKLRMSEEKNQDLLGPETAVTVNFPEIVDPHETAFRIWFNRGMKAIIVAGYVELFYLSWFTEKPIELVEPTVVKRVCTKTDVTGVREDGRPIPWHECKTTFSNGTYYKTLGDLKP